MPSFIGIDLGTTFSVVSTIDATGRPVPLKNSDGNTLTPSCVAGLSQEKFEVSEAAIKQWGTSPETAAARFKRDMGTSTTHSINNQEFTPTALSAMVLKKLHQDAARELGEVGEAVVTVPANFANEAREATMAAAKQAGLDVRYIINEPTAAALYYAFKFGEELHGNYAVYDLGGGTFDVSIMRVDGQDMDVLVSNGVSTLGGDNFDSALREIVQSKYQEASGEELEEEDFTLNESEVEKISLSSREKCLVRVNKKNIEVTRDEFEEAISSLVTQAEMLCEATIEEAGLDCSDIRAVFLAGGSTRIPMVRESVKRVFKQEPESSANVDEVVSMGAALYAAYKGDRSNLSETQKRSIEKIKVNEITNKCYGTITFTHDTNRDERTLKNKVLIPKNQKIPCSETESFFTIRDDQQAVSCRITESKFSRN